jgi:hypothetical protein
LYPPQSLDNSIAEMEKGNLTSSKGVPSRPPAARDVPLNCSTALSVYDQPCTHLRPADVSFQALRLKLRQAKASALPAAFVFCDDLTISAGIDFPAS